MPDRAVVDDDWVERIEQSISVQLEANTYTLPPPRALVALSEDRETLVVLDEPGDMSARPGGGWVLWHRSGPYSWGFYDHMEDTGQSADDVLAAWQKDNQEYNRGPS